MSSLTPRQAIGPDLIGLRDAATPLQSAEDRRAVGAAAIEISLIKQNMERELTRLGEIADDLEARLNRPSKQPPPPPPPQPPFKKV